jgi:hypothetical protein
VRSSDSGLSTTPSTGQGQRSWASDTLSSLGRGTTKVGSNLRNKVNGFQPGGQRSRSEQERPDNSDPNHSAYESMREGGSSTGEEGRRPSTDLSSASPLRPESLAPPTLPVTDASTTANTDENTSAERKIHFSSEFDKAEPPQNTMSREEKEKAIEGLVAKGRMTAEEWAELKNDPYKMTRRLQNTKWSAVLGTDAPAEQPSQTQKQPMSQFVLRHYAEELKTKFKKIAHNGEGGCSEAFIESAVRGAMQGYLGDVYDGSVATTQWESGWEAQAKPPETVITVALDKEDKGTYKTHWISTMKLKIPDATAEMNAALAAHFDENCDTATVELTPAHPLWSKYSHYEPQRKAPDFETLDKEYLQRMRDEEATILAAGGTEKEVHEAWDKKYGPIIDEGGNYVSFANINRNGTYKGKMGDGTEVIYTRGPAPNPHQKLTVDMSSLGMNPLCATSESMAREDAENAKTCWAMLATCEQNKKIVEAERAARKAAVAKWKATPRPLPSKNGATSLSDMPEIDISTNLSWSGSNMSEWTTGATDVTEENARNIVARILTESKVSHLLGEKFPALSKLALREFGQADEY